MKPILILMLVMCCGKYTIAQTPKKSETSPIRQAHKYLTPAGPFYDPPAAYRLFMEEAVKGNAEAMNGLGQLYLRGLGTSQNYAEARKWFEKAAKSGYAGAWYNWGLMYKEGLGMQQDFKKAFDIFSAGAARGYHTSLYAKGYMLYKGLGCTQSYTDAIVQFRKGIAEGEIGSMYMLGLCFRNGYGIKANSDSARYWINAAASKGYRYAKEEQEEAEPENRSALKNSQSGIEPANTKREIQKIKHSAKAEDLSGSYNGYLVRFDWSGKHVIGESKLKLNLQGSGNNFSGSWIEDDALTAYVKAVLTDSAILFNNTSYQRDDHYSAKKLISFEFRDARLHLVKTKDSVYLAGTVQLYSTQRGEPEKPIYISLSRKLNKSKGEEALAYVASEKLVINDGGLNNAEPVQTGLKVYPNPFSNNINVGFMLKESQNVEFLLANTLGVVVHKVNMQLQAGNQNIPLEVNVPVGVYVLRMRIGDAETSTLVIKQ